ncbi:hypothetical protein H5410_037335 [Solanum commersonii]|uniref:Uncharacterized protein n=1 Tax=Solanum commersonii TaxID=4109 RepID=A0A9J5Y867_SOLCO|nr:hypothetical protein H5410_037335 [Solanum commersonii]
MDNEIQKLKSKDSTSQQHAYKNVKLRRSEDEKIPEIEGDVGKLPKTHNICSITIQVQANKIDKDIIILEDIGQQPEIQKIEIPNFYANKRIIDISTIIQELANNYFNGNAIWKERPTTRALKTGFISAKLLTRYYKLIGHKYPDHICSKCNGEDNVIPDVQLE